MYTYRLIIPCIFLFSHFIFGNISFFFVLTFSLTTTTHVPSYGPFLFTFAHWVFPKSKWEEQINIEVVLNT